MLPYISKLFSILRKMTRRYRMNSEYVLLLEDKRPFSCWCIYKYKYYFLVVPIVIATVFLLIINVEFQYQTHEVRLVWPSDDYNQLSAESDDYLIKNEGCTIPGFDPFDPAIMKYHYPPKPIECYNDSNPPLISSNLTDIWIEEKYFNNYNITDNNNFYCCYRPFFRENSTINDSDNRYTYKDCINFTDATRILEEFIKIECFYNESKIYTDFHAFVQPKKHVEQNKNEFKVLVLGLDAVSRLNFYRTMPETIKRLKNMGAVDFRGYNKVDDNTYPNLVPVLSGYSAEELSKICVPLRHSRFDSCPFIWKNFSSQGYLTAFVEDASNMALFNYMKDGFADLPTDYYWRPFEYAAEDNIGHEKRLNAKLCLGPRLAVEVILDFVYKFAKMLQNSPYFGFFWETSLTHDYLNYPMTGDNKYATLLDTLKNESLLKDTILIVLSDHGIRWGSILTTHQGHMESRLPFLFITLPETFKEKYPLATYNLQRNKRRLTTPFDLHETMMDLLDVDQLNNADLKKRYADTTYLESRGISLFTPIGENRTCESAGIIPQWCTCHNTKPMNVDDEVVIKVANIVVEYLNSMLIDYSECAQLNLTKITDATVAEPTDAKGMQKVAHIIHDYTVIISTTPGDALFEATVRHSPQGWNIAGTVNRLNLYGDQSKCIDDFHLKLYCFCDNNSNPR